MTTYNFSQISDFEFESLCRDLLQAEFGHSLELFAPGPDGGIDIRYIGEVDGEEHTIVAQCKRWDENSFDNLLRHLSRGCRQKSLLQIITARSWQMARYDAALLA